MHRRHDVQDGPASVAEHDIDRGRDAKRMHLLSSLDNQSFAGVEGRTTDQAARSLEPRPRQRDAFGQDPTGSFVHEPPDHVK